MKRTSFATQCRISLDRMARVAERLSGHRSCTQNITGARLKFLSIMAGIPTAIGDGSKTKIRSNTPRQQTGAKRLAKIAKKKKFRAKRHHCPLPFEINGTGTT